MGDDDRDGPEHENDWGKYTTLVEEDTDSLHASLSPAYHKPPKPNIAKPPSTARQCGHRLLIVPDDVKLRAHVLEPSVPTTFLLLPHAQLTLGRSPYFSLLSDILPL